MFIASLAFWLLCQDPALAGVVERLRSGRDFEKARVAWEIVPTAHATPPLRYGMHKYTRDQVAYELHYPTMPPHTELSDHGIFQGLTWQGGYLAGRGDVRIWRQFNDLNDGHGPQIDFRRLGIDVAPRLGALGQPPVGAQPDYRVSVVGDLVEVSRQDERGQTFTD